MAINTAMPAPQADRIDKIAVVVDAVCAGADTADAIAHTLGVVVRQGDYYAAAAAYLGLVEPVASSAPTTYVLTTDGAQYLASDAFARAAQLTELIGLVPAVQIFMAADLEAVQSFYEMSGLGATTAARRAQTILGWAEAASSGAIDASEIEASTLAARAAAPAIAAALAAERAAAKKLAAGVTAVAFCQRCFLQLPVTAVCGNC